MAKLAIKAKARLHNSHNKEREDMFMKIYNDMLDIRDDENYHNEVHCIECSNGFIGIVGWHRPVNKIIADMYNGNVAIEENPLGHNLHIITDTENYYAKTK